MAVKVEAFLKQIKFGDLNDGGFLRTTIPQVDFVIEALMWAEEIHVGIFFLYYLILFLPAVGRLL